MKVCQILIGELRTFKEMLTNMSGLGVPNFYYKLILAVKVLMEVQTNRDVTIYNMCEKPALIAKICMPH